MEINAMSVAELMPSIKSLRRVEKLELIQWLATDLVLEDQASSLKPIVLPLEDQCPATPQELARARAQPGVYTLQEILESLPQ